MLAERLNELGGMRLLRAQSVEVAWRASAGRIRGRASGRAVYAVQLDIALLAVDVLVALLRQRPVWAGQLLSGRLPEALTAAVVPSRLSEVTAWCGCPDEVSWCKHAMATLLSVDAAGIGALLAWRGVQRSALVQALAPAAAARRDVEGFWRGGSLPRPVPGVRPMMQEMPPLDIHGEPIQAVLEGSVAKIRRAARVWMGDENP
ncbi:MAG: hypothetical protein ACI8S6_002937 [Myxococcota bacterium]|jgi:hypothetical protein